MGMYDTFGKLELQLKVGECAGFKYEIGDDVPIADGIYLDYGGAVVVKDGKFIAEFENVTSKWGHQIEPRHIINELNPITQAIKQAQQNEQNNS